MNKETVKCGNIITNGYDTAYVRYKTPLGVKVIINGEKKFIGYDVLKNWEYANPIKDNRIVSSKTFAVRFKQFLKWIPENWWMSQPHYYEEYEYLIDVADNLLNYQIQTATSDEEIDYLKNVTHT